MTTSFWKYSFFVKDQDISGIFAMGFELLVKNKTSENNKEENVGKQALSQSVLNLKRGFEFPRFIVFGCRFERFPIWRSIYMC